MSGVEKQDNLAASCAVTTETIAAIASAKGAGSVGVVRVSGPLAATLGNQISKKKLPARRAIYSEFFAADDSALDLGLILFFPGPNSFTGEDVLELQGHGGGVVLDRVLARVLQLGARQARPGEFSERAFLNNKIDLVQAESIAALIAADSDASAQAAVRSLQGEFSAIINLVLQDLIGLRQYVEAAIDFPDEELELFSAGEIGKKLQGLQVTLQQVLARTNQGVLLTDGVKTVITGRANAGKSSLLNLLSGEDAAIVTAQAGTTRDLLKTNILLDGIKLQLIDTAGLRETQDIIEQEGIRRALAAAKDADLVLLVIDGAQAEHADTVGLLQDLQAQAAARTVFVAVYNKMDLLSGQAKPTKVDGVASVFVSAKTGFGVDELKLVLQQAVGFSAGTENVYSARRRHIVALENALVFVNQGLGCLQAGVGSELVAEELRLAQRELSEITGEFSADDLLGKIFAEFCIGK